MPFKRQWVLVFGLLGLLTHTHFAMAEDRFSQQQNDASIRYQILTKQVEATGDQHGKGTLEACGRAFSDPSASPEPADKDWLGLEECFLRGAQARFAEVFAEPVVVAGTDVRALCGGFARGPDVERFYDCYYDHLSARRHFLSLVKKGSKAAREQCAVEICGDTYKETSRWDERALSRLTRRGYRTKDGAIIEASCFPKPTGIPQSDVSAQHWLQQILKTEGQDSPRGITARRCLNMAQSVSAGIGGGVVELAAECYVIAGEPEVAAGHQYMPARTRISAANFCRSRSNPDGDDYAACLSDQFDAAHTICYQLTADEESGALAYMSRSMCRTGEKLAGQGSAILDWQALLWCGMPPGKSPRYEAPKIHDFPIQEFVPIGDAGEILDPKAMGEDLPGDPMPDPEALLAERQ